MIVWAEIDSAPRLALYREDGALAHIDTNTAKYRVLGDVGDIHRPFSLLSQPEAANVDLSLKTDDDLYARWFDDPPLKKGIVVYSFETQVRTLFSGTIVRLMLTPVMTLFVEA